MKINTTGFAADVVNREHKRIVERGIKAYQGRLDVRQLLGHKLGPRNGRSLPSDAPLYG